MSDEKVYLNGALVDADEARLSVWDVGFLRGASVFTTMLARNGRVFRFEHHLQRLARAVRALNLRVEAEFQDLRDATAAVLSANAPGEARVRITLSPGSTRHEGPTVLITAEPLGELPAEWYTEGVRVTLCPWRQFSGDPLAGLKTGNYLPRTLAFQDAALKGAQEALWYTERGHLALG